MLGTVHVIFKKKETHKLDREKCQGREEINVRDGKNFATKNIYTNNMQCRKNNTVYSYSDNKFMFYFV